jgi:hypothetical protein
MRGSAILAVVVLVAACASPSPSPTPPSVPTDSPASVGSTTLTGLFGSPYDQLSADFRAGIDTRLKAIVPANFDQLSDTEQFEWVLDHQNSGLARLDDATLARRLRLSATAVGKMPVAACAAFTRERVNNGRLRDATADAFLGALAVDEQKDWVEIHVAAIEADVHETPVPRTVTDEEASRLFDLAASLATPEELSAAEAFGDPSQSDAVRCAGIRAISAATLRVPEADLATLARDAVER